MLLHAGRADDLLALLELEDIATRRAKGFSQGQRLKVALARALVHAPRNLILDEPTNGLDVPAVRKLRALLMRLRDQGQCILFSSHVMQEVALLCDDVVVITRGTVVAQGSPEDAAGLDGCWILRGRIRGADGRARGHGLMRSTLTVFVKEFLENLRDRRTVMMALLVGRCSGRSCSAPCCSSRWSATAALK